MMFTVFLLFSWLQLPIAPAEKGAISTLDNGISHMVLWSADSTYFYEVFNGSSTMFYAAQDTIGIFDLSSYDTMIIFARRSSPDSIEIIRFVNLTPDTFYTLYAPQNCHKLQLYNDAHLHPTFPIWYLLCKNDSGIFITHSSNYGSSFYPFDTVLIDSQVDNFDFMTSVNQTGDRVHLVYSKKTSGNNYLYLINGSYPASFTDTVKIDSMIPDSGNFTIYAIGDTLFIAYERYSFVGSDIDLYFVVSFYEGDSSTLQPGTISATTLTQKYPLIIPGKDTLMVFFLDMQGQNSNNIIKSIFPSPYTNPHNTGTIYEGNISIIKGDRTSHFPAILALSFDGYAYFIYDDTYSSVQEAHNFNKFKTKKHTGIYAIDGRRITEKPIRGLYIKNGKKVVIFK